MDRLVAVDGEAVNHYTHEQLVDKIHQLGNRCCLLVVDDETHKMYKMVSLLSSSGVCVFSYLAQIQIIFQFKFNSLTWPFLFTFMLKDNRLKCEREVQSGVAWWRSG